MPKVANIKYPYTAAGKKAAAAHRKRKADKVKVHDSTRDAISYKD